MGADGKWGAEHFRSISVCRRTLCGQFKLLGVVDSASLLVCRQRAWISGSAAVANADVSSPLGKMRVFDAPARDRPFTADAVTRPGRPEAERQVIDLNVRSGSEKSEPFDYASGTLWLPSKRQSSYVKSHCISDSLCPWLLRLFHHRRPRAAARLHL